MNEEETADAYIMYGLAMEYAKIGQADEAIKWFDRTIEIDPDHCYAFFHKARVQTTMNQFSEAIATLRQGLDRANACRDLKAAAEIDGFLEELEN
jgi:tetratricopeptide (TPR) repeat protein